MAKRFTPHSLRYGGASTLAAANIPEYKIQMAGRWKSNAFMIYIKESFQMFVQTQEALANPSLIRVEDVRRLWFKRSLVFNLLCINLARA